LRAETINLSIPAAKLSENNFLGAAGKIEQSGISKKHIYAPVKTPVYSALNIRIPINLTGLRAQSIGTTVSTISWFIILIKEPTWRLLHKKAQQFLLFQQSGSV
jgi:hypothetical protein